MRSRAAFMLVALLAVLAAVVFAVRWREAESRARRTEAWTRWVMDSLGQTIHLPDPPRGPRGRDSVSYWRRVATTGRLHSQRWQQTIDRWVERQAVLLDRNHLQELHDQGLADPPRQLRDSLVAHPELIPFDGVLGGRMGFYSPEDIVLLWPPYVFAPFDDGHIGGTMLLEYEVAQGRIRWKRLWTRLDGGGP